MQKATVDELESEPEGSLSVDRRSLTDALETSNMAINYFMLEPGEAFAGGMHAHLDQEEVFYVIEGVATFETKRDAAGESTFVKVKKGEAIRFEPGEFQQGRNKSDGRVIALALGAPKNSTNGRVPRTCPECGDSAYMDTILCDGELRVQCPECNVIQNSHLH